MVAAIIAVSVAAFHLLTIRPGHYWGDDFAMYILHARNIAHGLPYGETGYIYNPSNPFLSPRTYPPVYPLMLAPIIRCCGANIEAMKVFSLLFFPAALLVIFLLFRKEIRAGYALALIAILGASPFFWDFKDVARPDLPFLLFVYLAFLGERISAAAASPPRRAAGIALAALATCLAFGTRTLGILLVPSFLMGDLLARRRPGRLSIIVTLTCMGWIALQAAIFGSDGSYFDQYAGWTPRVLLNNLLYVESLANFWDNGYWKPVTVLVALPFAALAAAGYAGRCRRGATSFEVFVPVYMAVILSWPAMQGLRFLMPLLPLLLFYSFAGLEHVRFRGGVQTRRVVFRGLMAAVALSFAADYTTADFGPIESGIHTPTAKDFFRFVIDNTRTNDVFIFAKPRALALCTGRSASSTHTPRNGDDLRDYFHAIGASYAALGPVEDKPLRALVEATPAWLTPVYSNADFSIYRVELSAE